MQTIILPILPIFVDITLSFLLIIEAHEFDGTCYTDRTFKFITVFKYYSGIPVTGKVGKYDKVNVSSSCGKNSELKCTVTFRTL